MLTGKRAFKYNITFSIEKIRLGIGFECNLKVVLRKGKKKYETARSPQLDLTSYIAIFNEQIKFQSIYIQDTSTGKFLDESNQLTVIIINEKGNKTAGFHTITPTQILNQKKINISETAP